MPAIAGRHEPGGRDEATAATVFQHRCGLAAGLAAAGDQVSAGVQGATFSGPLS